MRIAMLVSLALTLAVVACERTKPAPRQAVASTSAATTNGPATVAKIVFIDKENACDCTRKRIEDTWAAMQAALGTPATLPVERIHVDTQTAQAEAYTMFKPLMVPPGVYFVDASNGVIELLQGEVTTEQIAAVLKVRGPNPRGPNPVAARANRAGLGSGGLGTSSADVPALYEPAAARNRR
ncbi:MAG: hypothetical protein IPL40_05795 [Proteobacteria bacterium]|nr:hypothetical protein [Pseudomonadota bacterium]